MRFLYLFFILFYFISFSFSEESSVEVYEVTQPDEVLDTDSKISDTPEQKANREYYERMKSLRAIGNQQGSNYSIDELFSKADSLFESKDYEKAINTYKLILKRDLKQKRAYLSIAKAYANTKDYERAASAIKALMKISNNKEYRKKYESYIKKFITQLKEFNLKYPEEATIPAKIGEMFYELKDYDSARKYAEDAIKINSEIPSAYYVLAHLDFDKGNIDKAYENISRAFRLEPESEDYFNFLNKVSDIKKKRDENAPKLHKEKKIETIYYTNALKSIERKDYTKALEQLELALKQYPDNKVIISKIAEVKVLKRDASLAKLDFNLGIRYFEEKKYDKALEKFYLLMSEKKQNLLDYLDFYSYLYKAEFFSKHWFKAMKACEKLLEQVPTDIEAYYYAGLSAEKLDQEDLAYKMFLKAYSFKHELIKYPIIKKAINSKLNSYMIKRNKWKIIVFFIFLGLIFFGIFRFINIPSFKKKRLLRKLSAAHSSRKLSDAKHILSKLEKMALSPGEAKAVYYSIAELYYQQSDYEKALTYLKIAIKKAPDNQQAHTLLGKVFMKKEIVSDEALYEYARLLKNEPSRELKQLIVFYFNRANEKSFKKWYKIFQNNLQNILESLYKNNPNSLDVLRLWTKIGLMNNKTDEKYREIYEKYLELSSDDVYAKQIKPILFKGFYTDHKYDKALNIGITLLSSNPDNQEFFLILSDICEKENRLSWLVGYIEKLSQKNPEINAYRNYIDILRNKVKKHEEKLYSTIDKNPSDINEEEIIKLFEQAKILFKNGEFNQAISAFRKCFKSTNDIHLKRRSSKLLILCYLRKGLYDLAKEQYEITDFDETIMPPDLKELCYLIAESFEKVGMYKDSLAMYDKICRVDVSYKDSFDRFERIRNYLEKADEF